MSLGIATQATTTCTYIFIRPIEDFGAVKGEGLTISFGNSCTCVFHMAQSSGVRRLTPLIGEINTMPSNDAYNRTASIQPQQLLQMTHQLRCEYPKYHFNLRMRAGSSET